MLNPVTDETVGNVNADAQVLAVVAITGADGNITTFTVLLVPHEPVPVAPAKVPPQVADNT